MRAGPDYAPGGGEGRAPAPRRLLLLMGVLLYPLSAGLLLGIALLLTVRADPRPTWPGIAAAGLSALLLALPATHFLAARLLAR